MSSSKSRAFDRRDTLKLGLAGLLGSQIMSLRAFGNSAGAVPPRRVILFTMGEGINWKTWAAKSMHEGAMNGKAGEKRMSEVISDVFNPSGQSIWSVFNEDRYKGLIGDVNMVDGIDNRASVGGEGGVDTHHHGMKGMKSGIFQNDQTRVVPFGGGKANHRPARWQQPWHRGAQCDCKWGGDDRQGHARVQAIAPCFSRDRSGAQKHTRGQRHPARFHNPCVDK